ncbi:DUF4282 domain-containing protein [Candidatus Acetothermia bacterium]|nr:DUF4282 domain-containing protein [Candidatus Acetothermia bacterium]MBI3643221.1 DUF4282 domain-containing protein [Candidatus Acetothermia bacterium]
MNDFLSFHRLITPQIIQVLFWIGAGVAVLVGLVMIVDGVTARYSGGGREVLTGIIILLLGPVAVRINCELIVTVFRISETLLEIKSSSAQKLSKEERANS